jgi:hypothetical protein
MPMTSPSSGLLAVIPSRAGVSLGRSLAHLAVALSIVSPHRPAAFGSTAPVATDLAELVARCQASVDTHSVEAAKVNAQRSIQDMLRTVALVLRSPCDEPGEVYLSTNANLNLQGSEVLHVSIEGNAGVQQFTFASGTSQANVVRAINTFMSQTATAAEASAINPQRVRLFSIHAGSDQFVHVQHDRSFTLLAPSAFGPVQDFERVDFGRDGIAGDVNCDLAVDSLDLAAVIAAWGSCRPDETCGADLNGSGAVDMDDLLLVIAHWKQHG